MRRGAIAAIAAVFVGVPALASAGGPDGVTFTKDVAPIFYARCAECHRPTMFAPMSLMTYESARPWAKSIRQKVESRQMPPWGADPAYGTFKNDPRLSQTEIDTITAWVDAGAPKGDPKDLPPAPQFEEGWSIGKPDVVFSMGEDFQIPATGEIPYKYFKVPTSLTEDRWIQAIEIRPEARAHVHHVLVYTQPTGQPLNPGGALGPTNIGGVTPNKPGLVFDPGVARRLRGNSDIVLQIHYTTNGTEATDRTIVGIVYAKEPPARLAGGGMALNARFLIPAHADNHEVTATQAIARDTLLTALTPHMHVRGKDMRYIAHYPDGTSETLLSVPKYDFNWQITYQLASPKLLPAGTKMEVIAHFDNSVSNKSNPDPSKDVKWGDQTWEEMMIGFWSTLVEPPARPSAPQQ
jgi:hypothetical protein